MRKRTASVLGWSLVALAAALVAAFGGIAVTHAGAAGRTASEITYFGQGALVGLLFPVVGALIASRHPRNAIGWIFIVVGLSNAASTAAEMYSRPVTGPQALPAAEWAVWLQSWIWQPGWFLYVTFLLLLFPDGRLPSERWRPVAWMAAASLAISMLASMLLSNSGSIPEYRNPLIALDGPLVMVMLIASGVLFLPAVFASVAALAVRFRRSRGEERQQLKWFTYAAVATVALYVGRIIPAIEIPWLQVLGYLSIPLLPVASLIAIFKHRLYDIDLVINRAVVYALLATFVTGLYIAIVVGIGAAVGRRGGLLLPGVAAAIVALIFHPARLRAQRFANRVVYGKRASPYEVLSEFSDRLAGFYSLDDVLPRMARIVAEGTAAEEASVWLHVGGELRREATWPRRDSTPATRIAVQGIEVPDLPATDRTLPVVERGELLGALSVRKPRGEGFTASEEKLLADLASQAGLVLRNVRLVEELRASRQRLVAAQDDERRRLERNIHDGAQQQLVAIAIRQRLAEQLVRRDPERTAELLSQLQADTNQALEDLRDLARGIYPPLLADRGLPAALEAQARKAPVPVEVGADGVARYPQEVKAAVYFCILEALQNVAKYAGASSAEVRLMAQDGSLAFTVADDGRGFDPDRTPRGTGLQNMADRLEALGGTLEVGRRPGGAPGWSAECRSGRWDRWRTLAPERGRRCPLSPRRAERLRPPAVPGPRGGAPPPAPGWPRRRWDWPGGMP